MEQTLTWRAARNAEGSTVQTPQGSAEPAPGPPDGPSTLAVYDSIRSLFLVTGLDPDPDTYELFWHYATGADAGLTRAMDRAMEDGGLTAEDVVELRRTHLGAIAAAEVHELVGHAQQQAGKLSEEVRTGHEELLNYDLAVANEDAALARGLSAPELSDLVQRLRRANARMMGANRRLEAELRDTLVKTAELTDRLEVAETAARTDPLTGLLNRRGTMEALRKACAEAQTGGEPLCAAMVDIDHFKRLNDQWGHSIGDEVLRHVAGLISGQLARSAAPGAFVGRVGGEEFLAVMPGQTLPRACALLDGARASLVRQVLRRATDGAGLGRISFSAGVAQARPEDCSESLADRADSALFAAKRAGRDRVLPELPDRR
ncbi:MAG: GGDEF domain-containing protein [Thermaurantiacus sp.]